MNLSYHLDEGRYPVRMRWFLAVAWALILGKCAAIVWIIGHWNVPIHPAWIVAPTLMIATLATALWFGQHEE